MLTGRAGVLPNSNSPFASGLALGQPAWPTPHQTANHSAHVNLAAQYESLFPLHDGGLPGFCGLAPLPQLVPACDLPSLPVIADFSGPGTRRRDLSIPVAQLEPPLRGEPFSAEHLWAHAALLASRHGTCQPGRDDDRFIKRFESNQREIAGVYRSITDAVRAGEPLAPSAEWVLDNYHIVEEQLRPFARICRSVTIGSSLN